MNKIISLQNSGESLEKAIALVYTARKSCRKFYEENSIIVYYGHNLPKKNKNIMPHGSVGFYEKYFSDLEFNPVRGEQTLINDKEKILQNLLNNGIITIRNMEKIRLDNEMYLKFIRLMPMDVIYSDFSKFICQKAESFFGNVSFRNIHLEDNYMKYYASLEKDKWAYSIYTLDYTGTISRFYLPNLELSTYSLRSIVHMFKEFDRKSCLSGNSAMFLAAIKDLTRNMEYDIGYREHKREVRKTRNYALDSILKVKNGVIEPKNVALSSYFNGENVVSLKNMEEKANMVFATVFKDFLDECIIK